MSEENKTILDAVNAAVDPLIEKGEDKTSVPESDETPEPEETPEQNVAPEGEAALEGEKPEGEEVAPEGETPEQKTTREAAAKIPEDDKTPESKKLDPVNDPIPATVSERTRERMTSLIGIIKGRDQIVSQHNELMETIMGTGMSADEFGASLRYGRLVHSENIEDRRTAYNILLTELRGLAPLIGETIPGEDPLVGHPDLADAVAAATISQKHAEELAQARGRSRATTVVQEQLTARQKEDAVFETARLAGVKALNELDASLHSDPQFAAKRAILVPALEPVFARLHPSQWVTAFKQAYEKVVVPAAARAAPTPKLGNQPMRANKAPAGEGKKQIGSVREAIEAGIAQATR